MVFTTLFTSRLNVLFSGWLTPTDVPSPDQAANYRRLMQIGVLFQSFSRQCAQIGAAMGRYFFSTFSTGILHPCETSNSFDPYTAWTGQFRANDEEEVSLGDFELPARDMTVTAQHSISYKDFVGPKRSKWLIQSPSKATMCKIWDSQRHPKTMISLH